MGTKKLEDFLDQLAALLQDRAALLDAGARQRAVAQAIEDYSADRPRRKKFDFTGDSATYDIPVPSDWVAAGTAGGFQSTVVSIEYPAGERSPSYLDPEEYLIYTKADGTQVIRLLETTPQSGKTARIEYTVAHTPPAAGTATSAPDADFYAICELAAAHAFLLLAARQAQTVDPTLGADTVDRQAQAEAYRALAREHRKNYAERLRKDAAQAPPAAGAVRDLDTTDQRGFDRLTHPGRLR